MTGWLDVEFPSCNSDFVAVIVFELEISVGIIGPSRIYGFSNRIFGPSRICGLTNMWTGSLDLAGYVDLATGSLDLAGYGYVGYVDLATDHWT